MDNSREILLRCFLFSGCEKAAEQTKFSPAVSYKKGQIIYDTLHFRSALGIMLSGRAQAVSASDSRTVLSAFAPGGVFGAAAVFGGGQKYVSRVCALSDCTVQFLDENELVDLFARYPQTAVNYISFLSAKIRFLNGKIATFTQSSAEGRLYGYLCNNADRNGFLDEKIKMVGLARTLDIGRTSVYRAFDSLEKQQLIARKDGKIQVIL